jgi:hypothetical protein
MTKQGPRLRLVAVDRPQPDLSKLAHVIISLVVQAPPPLPPEERR